MEVARAFLPPWGEGNTDSRGWAGGRNPNAAECFPCRCSEGSSFHKTAPERRPGSSPCWKPHHSWGGWRCRQWQHQLALNQKGVRAPSPGPTDGAVGCALGIQSLVPKWVLTRSKVLMKPSAASCSRSAPLAKAGHHILMEVEQTT